MRKLQNREIDVKVKQVFQNGAVLLLYKTSRVDMSILDETYGSMNWQCDYKVVKDNLYCGIGVRDEKGEWVWKWDCGIESREDDGNEKKGEASDAFKRAGFKWGIGIELYSSPFIFAKVETVEEKGKWYLKNKFQKFSVQKILYDESDEIAGLVIEDDKGNIVFQWKKKGFKVDEKGGIVDRYWKAVEFIGKVKIEDFKKKKEKIKGLVDDIVKGLEENGDKEKADFLKGMFEEKENMC